MERSYTALQCAVDIFIVLITATEKWGSMHRRVGIRIVALLGVILGASVLDRGTPGLGSVPLVRADAVTSVTVHYVRFAADYGPMDTTNGWNLWMWPYQPVAGAGAAYAFTSTDSFGEVAHVAIPGANTKVGIIVRQGDFKSKDTPDDRFVDTPSGSAEVWVVQGDPTIYYSLAAAETAKSEAAKSKPVHAFLDSPTGVSMKFTNPVDLTTTKPSDFSVKDTITGATIPVTGLADLSGQNPTHSDLLTITLGSAPDVTHRLSITYGSYTALSVYPRLVLNDPQYTYTGSDLGNVYAPTGTSFRLWAPLASAVSLVVYKDLQGNLQTDTPMVRSDHGTWTAAVNGDLKNMVYYYRATNFGTTEPGMDPYAYNAPANGSLANDTVDPSAQGFLSQIVDLSSTNPAGWSSDTYRATKQPEDASLWEVHVRDFSINPNSGMTHRGTYLAFTETGTKNPSGTPTGVDHIKALGVSHVELLPTQRCASIDELTAGQTTLAANGDYQHYNWCYDPLQYNVLNGAYATDPNGPARIGEYKQMVMALHKRGLGVVQDVVYNHTANTAVFDNIVPNYYYRQDYSGTVEKASCCPDLAAERPMVRKLILDSVAYLATQYHLDGFRFDLMSLLGTGTVKAISQELHKLNPHVVILGEPWDLGATLTNDQQLTEGGQRGLKVAVFNDQIRNAIQGSPFDRTVKGYATGDPTQAGAIKIGIAGETHYRAGPSGFADSPQEVINYASVHDNLTIWDHIQAADPAADDATKIKMDELAQGIVFTAQGIPFMAGGDEMLRTKGGNDNSYQAGDAVNMLDWSRLDTYKSVAAYYANLLHLRNTHPAFRLPTAGMIQNHLIFMDSPQSTVEYKLTGHANKDSWSTIVVALNPNPSAVKVKLPKGSWNLVATQGTIGTKTLGHRTGNVSVPGYTMDVLYQK
jgi:pullulanase